MDGWPDLFRLVIFGLYGVVITLTAQILVCYRKAQRERSTSPRGPGLLTRHVLTISGSYLVLATECLYENVARVGDPFTLYIPANLVGFTFGIYALSEMLKFQRTRVKV